MVVFALVVLAWVPFKLPNLSSVGRWWGAMLLGRGGLGAIGWPAALLALALLVIVWVPKNSSEWRISYRAPAVAGLAALLLATLLVGYGRLNPSPFLYFRF